MVGCTEPLALVKLAPFDNRNKCIIVAGKNDVVFRKLMALPSGRELLAKMLNRIMLPARCFAAYGGNHRTHKQLRAYTPVLHCVWALLRNARHIFSFSA